MTGERFVFSLGGRFVGGQRMLLDVSEAGFGLCGCSKAGSLCLAAEMGQLGEAASVSALRVQEKGAFGAAGRKRGGAVGLSYQPGGVLWPAALPLGWLFIRKEPAGRAEPPEPAQAIRSLSGTWPALVLPVPLVTFVREHAGTWWVPGGFGAVTSAAGGTVQLVTSRCH